MSPALITGILTLALLGGLFLDLRAGYTYYLPRRKHRKITVSFWRWWFQTNRLKATMFIGMYLLGLVLVYAPDFSLNTPAFDLITDHLWTLLLLGVATAVLLFDLKLAHRHYRKLRHKGTVIVPYWKWWLLNNRGRLSALVGSALIGLLLMYASDISGLIPVITIGAATANILRALALSLVVAGVLVFDLRVAYRFYGTQRQQGAITEPFRQWWLRANRVKLLVAGWVYLVGMLLICIPDFSLDIPLLTALAGQPGATPFALLILALLALLLADLKLARAFYRAENKQGRLTEPFWRWWLVRNILKILLFGGVFSFGLSLVLFPEFTLDIPILNLVFNPQFLLFLLGSDPRTLAGLLATALLTIYLTVDLLRARTIYRDFVKSSGVHRGFLHWWAAKNRFRLAVAGGGYLGGLLVAFIIIPWGMTHFGGGPARYLHNATTYFQQKKYQEAAGELRKALRKEPGNATIHLALAQTLGQLGSPKEALAESRTATQLDPNLYQAHLLQANLALAAGDTSQALTAARTARDLQPKLTEPRALLARIHTMSQEHEPAAALLRKLATEEPGNPEYRNLLVANALARRAYAEANREAQTGPGQNANGELHLLRAAALLELGRFDDALAAQKSAAALDPKSPRPYLAMAAVALRKNDHRAAIAYFEEALKRDPNNLTVLNNLASLLADHDFDLARAAQLAAQAYRQDPNSPNIIDTLGWLSYRQKKYPEAVTLLRQAVSLAPTDPELRYHLGAALIQAGDAVDGRAALTQALKLSSTFPGAEQARALLHHRSERDTRR